MFADHVEIQTCTLSAITLAQRPREMASFVVKLPYSTRLPIRSARKLAKVIQIFQGVDLVGAPGLEPGTR
jgi:hypothetical protein